MATIDDIDFELPDRWYPLDYHATQSAFFHCSKSRIIVPAGRRSGKTEIAKRKGVLKGLRPRHHRGYIVFGAPTYDQAKKIYWDDLKALIPREFIIGGRAREGSLQIPLITGPIIIVTGLDKPERIEGIPILWMCLDEFGNMHKDVWAKHLLPAMSNKRAICQGEVVFIGVPEGRNHYFDLWNAAQDKPNWACFHWKSSEILSEEDIAQAREDLDEKTFKQEYEGSFESSTGAVYYTFDPDVNAANKLRYDDEIPLIICFDFNVKPGSVVFVQEDQVNDATHVVDELFIKDRYTNCEELCQIIITRYGAHKGKIVLAGDPSGGAKNISQTAGTAWDQIRQIISTHFGHDRVRVDVGYEQIRERPRVMALNSRIRNCYGKPRLFVDPKCKNLIADFEGVNYKEGTTEIEKKSDSTLTHLSEALGFYVARKHPAKYKAEGKHVTMRL